MRMALASLLSMNTEKKASRRKEMNKPRRLDKCKPKNIAKSERFLKGHKKSKERLKLLRMEEAIALLGFQTIATRVSIKELLNLLERSKCAERIFNEA